MANVINRQSEDWLTTEGWAKKEREELVACLIAQENEEIRGRIKQLDELLDLPNKIDRDAGRP